jgi:hypothetical protein
MFSLPKLDFGETVPLFDVGVKFKDLWLLREKRLAWFIYQCRAYPNLPGGGAGSGGGEELYFVF